MQFIDIIDNRFIVSNPAGLLYVSRRSVSHRMMPSRSQNLWKPMDTRTTGYQALTKNCACHLPSHVRICSRGTQRSPCVNHSYLPGTIVKKYLAAPPLFSSASAEEVHKQIRSSSADHADILPHKRERSSI